MRILKTALAATVSLSLVACANTGAFCENQPWVCGAVAIGAVAAVILATGVFEGAPDPPDTGEIPMISDSRLKTDIRPEGELANGVRVYSFRYRNDERRFIGVVAQDLLEDARFRHAVSIGDGGYYVVDLAALGLSIAGDAAQFAEAGRHALDAAARIGVRVDLPTPTYPAAAQANRL